MNIGGGEAADQLVRMMLSGTEVVVRLGGSALKNLLAMTMALAKNNKVLSGKVNMGKMLRETRDLRQFPMTPEQYHQFAKLAKKQKILFSAIRDKDDRGKLIDVILPVTELDRANQIFERVLGQSQEQRSPQLERAAPRQQEKETPERSAPQKGQKDRQGDRQGQGKGTPQKGREHPQTAPREREDKSRREGAPSKKDSRSGRGSNGTRTSSSTPQKAAVTRTASDRPSVEGRLKVYRVQLDQKRKSVPTRKKVKAKQR